MDIRLYILGGLVILLLALVLYLIAAMFSYCRAVRRARGVGVVSDEAPASVVQVETRAQAPIAPRPQEPRPPEPEVLEYRMVAPVELHFTEGDARVGVRPGTRTFAEFQRLASALLDDLASHRTTER